MYCMVIHIELPIKFLLYKSAFCELWPNYFIKIYLPMAIYFSRLFLLVWKLLKLFSHLQKHYYKVQFVFSSTGFNCVDNIF